MSLNIKIRWLSLYRNILLTFHLYSLFKRYVREIEDEVTCSSYPRLYTGDPSMFAYHSYLVGERKCIFVDLHEFSRPADGNIYCHDDRRDLMPRVVRIYS